MGSRAITERARDKWGNVVGGSAYEIHLSTKTLPLVDMTYYLDDALSLAGPAYGRPFPGGIKATTGANMLVGDDTVQVDATTGFAVGDAVHIDGSAGRFELIIRSILAGPARLRFATTLGLAGAGATMNAGAIIGGYEDEGFFKCFVPDTDDTYTRLKVAATGKDVFRKLWPTLAPASAPTMPNLVLNSDFGRRTVLGLAMPEVFADLSGATKIDGGAAGSVASNIFTQGAAQNEYAWCAGAFVWRDGRASATFKMVATTGQYTLRWRIDANNHVRALYSNGMFYLEKLVGGSGTTVASVAQAGTLNRWYWLEIEKQGTTFIAKLYDTGGTASGVTKASSTLLQTLTGTVADAGLQVGAHISVTSDQAAAQWGGIATGNGGVYVETWLPESFTTDFTPGTLGGPAFGYDESADAGPIGKQYAIRAYCPATSRRFDLLGSTATTLPVVPSVSYTLSGYVKVSGLGGAGALIKLAVEWRDSSGTLISTTSVTDAGEAAYTRKSATATAPANARFARVYIEINPASTASGTAFISCLQLEQGSAATAWRNAPADDGPFIVAPKLPSNAPTTVTTSSTSFVDADPMFLAADVFMPWDGTLTLQFLGSFQNNTVNVSTMFTFSVDGADISGAAGLVRNDQMVATNYSPISMTASKVVAAGKHRVAVQWKVAANTASLIEGAANQPAQFQVIATRGK